MDDQKALLGRTVKDRVSGISGVVIGVVTWLHNPMQSLIVQPPAQDGKVPATVYVPQPAADLLPVPKDMVQ